MLGVLAVVLGIEMVFPFGVVNADGACAVAAVRVT